MLSGAYDQVYWDWLSLKSDVKVKLKSQHMFRAGKAVLHAWNKLKWWPRFKELVDNTVEFGEPRLTNELIVMNCHALALVMNTVSHCPHGMQLAMQAVRFLACAPLLHDVHMSHIGFLLAGAHTNTRK